MRRFWAVCLLVVLALAAPGAAFAAEGDYSIDELSTEVAVETNAATHVIERQIVTFDTRNAGYIWYLHVPEDGEAVRISSIRVAPVDDGGSVIGDWTRLQLVDSRAAIQGANPGDKAALSLRSTRTQPWYSYNIGDGKVRCWFPVGADVRTRLEQAAEEATADDSEELAIDESLLATRYVIEADYTISHRVRVYRDVGELY